MTPSQIAMKREVMMDDLKQALEVLPTVVDEIGQYTDASLESYANRIILATCILHNIERKLNEGYQAAQRGDDHAEDEGDEEDRFFRQDDGPTEQDKDRAIAQLAAEASGADYYDTLEAMEEADAEEYREFADGID